MNPNLRLRPSLATVAFVVAACGQSAPSPAPAEGPAASLAAAASPSPRPSVQPPERRQPASGDRRHGPRGRRPVRAARPAPRARRRRAWRHDRGHRRGALRARPPQHPAAPRRPRPARRPGRLRAREPGPERPLVPARVARRRRRVLRRRAAGGRRRRPRATRPRPSCSSRLAAASDAPLTLVTLGPLSNVADAAALDPAFASHLAGIHAMAGTIDAPGNISLRRHVARRRRRVERRRGPRRDGGRPRARRPDDARRASTRPNDVPGPCRHRRPAGRRPCRGRRRHRVRDVRPHAVPRRRRQLLLGPAGRGHAHRPVRSPAGRT